MWLFVVAIVALAAAVAFQPKIPQARKLDDDPDLPIVEEGKPISVIFGTVDLKSPNVVWWGDWEQRAIKKDGERIGYRQWMGMHLVFCHGPIDKLLGIYGDKDKEIWTGAMTTNTRLTIDKGSIYGNRKTGEGGVEGPVSVMFGYPDQTINNYLNQNQELTTTFRGVFGLVLEFCNVGNSKYIKPWWVRVQRIHKTTYGATQWYDEKAQIGSWDMNPAHIVRECLLNSEWGAGESGLDVDATSFVTCADTFYNEGLGLSMKWTSDGDVYEFIESVLQQCNAVLYQDPKDGKFYMRAIRADYVKENLPLIDRSSIVKVRDVKRPAPATRTNTLTCKYFDRERADTGALTLQDTAAVELYGEVADKVEYPGIQDKDTANTALARDLAVASRSLRSVSLICNRDAADLVLGQAFVLDHPDYMFDNAVMRVTEIGYGGGQKNEVMLSCAEDAFAAPPVFQIVPPSTWTPPSTAPVPVSDALLIPFPWYALQLEVTADKLASIDMENAVYYGMISVVPATGMSDFDLLVKPYSASVYEDYGSGSFGGLFTLAADIGLTDTAIPIAAFTNARSVVAGAFAVIENEWMYITNVASAEVTVVRGVLGTFPASHSMNAKAYVFTSGTEDVNLIDYAVPVSSVTFAVKHLTVASGGTLDEASANVITSAISYPRLWLPTPPAAIKFNSMLFPAASDYFSGNCVVTWESRPTRATSGQLTGWNNVGAHYNTGATTHIEVRAGGTVVVGRTQTVAAGGASWTYTTAMEVTDFGQLQESLTFKMWTTDSNGSSIAFEWTVYRNPEEVNPPASFAFNGVDSYVDITE